MRLTDSQREQAVALFQRTQDRLGKGFETVDGMAQFVKTPWQKPEDVKSGGVMGVIRGQVVEKAGANYSAVHGVYPNIEKEHAGKPFFASGVSTITHMMNPHAPIGHMNVRLIDVGDEFWVGGGADLTPFIQFPEDTADFHAAMQKACDSYAPDAYEKYSKWCDEYFYIPHRKSIRGVGGIFFDYLKGDFNTLFALLEGVAEAYVTTFLDILARRAKLPYTPGQKEGQLFWRGRYAEFNLVYDRGTKFGLQTGGNIDAIFVSLPPVVKW